MRVPQSGCQSRSFQGGRSPGTGERTGEQRGGLQRCGKQVSEQEVGQVLWLCEREALDDTRVRLCHRDRAAGQRAGTVTGQDTCRFREKADGDQGPEVVS